MRKIVVLFDLDGTLVKAGGSGRKALNRAVVQLHAFEEVCSTFSLEGRMDRQNFRLALTSAIGRAPTRREVRAVEDAYLKLLPNEVRKAVKAGRYLEIPGVSKLLRALAKRKNVLLGLGTGNIREGAHIKLKPSGFLRYFTFGGYGRDGRSRAHMLRLAVGRAETLAGRRVSPADVRVIGDTARDVFAGRRSGYKTGIVIDGYGDVDAIRRAKPDLLEPDFRDTRRWLDWILR
ncbi:MAG: HAD hydrolase-like protein [Elusimicrobia bacterium]|nr:HAD hydrolase-like protein [Elusimicrobiota bacterium]